MSKEVAPSAICKDCKREFQVHLGDNQCPECEGTLVAPSAEMQKLLGLLREHTNLYGAVVKNSTIMEKSDEWADKISSYIRTLEKENEDLKAELDAASPFSR